MGSRAEGIRKEAASKVEGIRGETSCLTRATEAARRQASGSVRTIHPETD